MSDQIHVHVAPPSAGRITGCHPHYYFPGQKHAGRWVPTDARSLVKEAIRRVTAAKENTHNWDRWMPCGDTTSGSQ